MSILYSTAISILLHKRSRQCLVGYLAVAGPCAPLAAELSVPDTLAGYIEVYNQHEDINLPQPTVKELDQLRRGRVIKFRVRYSVEQEDGRQRQRIRVVGYRLVEQPRMLVWLAALDFGTRHSSRLTEYRVGGNEAGGSVWYQYLHLPWPVRNRHWMIRSYKNTSLAAASQGIAWEHAWGLEKNGPELVSQLLADGSVPGLTPRDGQRAIYVPVNHGGWTMFADDDRRTFVAAHVTSELGGWIPDGLVASLVSNQLETMMNGLAPRALTIDEQYNIEYPVFTGDGRMITREMARNAAASLDRAMDRNPD